MSQLVTRCPHCSTSFHVSEPQLRAARGAVRCGSCLQVFRADENIVFDEGDPQPADKKAIEELLEDDDFLIHDDIELDGNDQSEDGSHAATDNSSPSGQQPASKAAEKSSAKSTRKKPTEGSPNARPKASPQAPAAQSKRPSRSPLIDDAFGEQQWQEMDSDDARRTPSQSHELDFGHDDLSPASDDPWAEEIAQEESSGVSSTSDGSIDDSIENFENEDAPFSDNLFDENPLAAAPEESHTDEVFIADEFDRFSDQGPVAGSAKWRGDGDRPGNERPLNSRQHDQTPLLPRDQLISAIGPAPIEVNWQPKRHNRVPGWLWLLGIILLALALVAQTAYFRFDTLSKREPWRAIYAQLCPLLDCRLPAQVDINAIRTSNLVVRSHPHTPGALAVEAVLLNRAPFDQPFPTLQLRFTDLKNTPVASRHFNPSDYLKGELSGRRLMPNGNPVHISLDIVDPGPQAVNYELRIAPQ